MWSVKHKQIIAKAEVQPKLWLLVEKSNVTGNIETILRNIGKSRKLITAVSHCNAPQMISQILTAFKYYKI